MFRVCGNCKKMMQQARLCIDFGLVFCKRRRLWADIIFFVSEIYICLPYISPQSPPQNISTYHYVRTEIPRIYIKRHSISRTFFYEIGHSISWTKMTCNAQKKTYCIYLMILMIVFEVWMLELFQLYGHWNYVSSCKHL